VWPCGSLLLLLLAVLVPLLGPTRCQQGYQQQVDLVPATLQLWQPRDSGAGNASLLTPQCVLLSVYHSTLSVMLTATPATPEDYFSARIYYTGWRPIEQIKLLHLYFTFSLASLLHFLVPTPSYLCLPGSAYVCISTIHTISRASANDSCNIGIGVRVWCNGHGHPICDHSVPVSIPARNPGKLCTPGKLL